MTSNTPANDTQSQPAPAPDTGPARAFAVAANQAAYWVSRHWLSLFNFFVELYIALPFAAPALMIYGYEGPAKILYAVYSPACHQLGFRSFFIDGEQGYYPLEETGITQVDHFQDYVADNPDFAGYELPADFGYYVRPAAKLLGNERMGFKVALCQRDVAMYLSILGGGMLFSLLRHRLKALPWQLFIVFGILPMLIDGGYQLATWQLGVIAQATQASGWLHDIAVPLSQSFPPHETIPLFRVITGSLFGLGLVWMTYPHIHEGMQDTERDLHDKLLNAKLIEASQ